MILGDNETNAEDNVQVPYRFIGEKSYDILFEEWEGEM